MSLINQMLRDLDERNAPTLDRAALPSHVRPLPPEKREFPVWLPVVAVAAVAVAWYLLAGRGEPPVAPPAKPPAPVVAVAPPAAVAPAPASPAATAAPAAVPATKPVPVPERHVARVEAPVAGLPPPTRKAKIEDNGLRMETVLPGSRDKRAPEAEAPATPAKGPAAAKDVAAAAAPATIDKRPRNAPANEAADNEYRKAMSAVRRGALAEGMERLQATLRLDAGHVSARQALLSLLVDQQQWAEAQALLVDGLALDPAQTGWAMALARLQLDAGKLAEAVDTLAKHARYAEQNADYLAFQALLLQKQKRSAEAAERYRAALALKPAEARWWYGLGLVLEAEQKTQAAREAFLKAKESGNLPPELAAAVEQRLR